MILGVLSDTHGQRQRTATALCLLERVGADAFVHCGDVGGEGVLDELAGRRVWLVWGNTDDPDGGLEAYARSLGLEVGNPAPLRLELDGRALAVFHGHETRFARLMAHLHKTGSLPPDFGSCDYVLHGHTHAVADTRVGLLRVLNAGAVFRAAIPSVATLDLRTDELRVWPLDTTTPPRPHRGPRPRRS